MEVNYKFIASLNKILFAQGDDWRVGINKEAANLLEKIAMLQRKLNEATTQSTTNLESQIGGMKARLVQLQDQTKYAWNVEPFKNIEDAKLLLANIHILEDPALHPHFNSAAVSAIKNMLSERFADFYDDEVNQLVLSKRPAGVQGLKPETVSAILTKQIPTIEEILTPALSCERAAGMTSKLAKYLPQANAELLSEITKSILMISKFYILNDHYIFNIFTPLVLSLCFDNIKDVEVFLANHVDYKNANSFENSFAQIQTLPDELPHITDDAKSIWSKMIAANGKQSMGLFFRSSQISRDLGKSIETLLEECDGNVELLFEKLQITAAKSAYEGIADETRELAIICSKYNISQEIFSRIAKEILPAVKDNDDLPDVSFDIEFKGQTLHFSKLPAGDLRGLFLGHETGCCQSIGGDSEAAVQDAFTRTDAGFYILTDANGKIKAQSLAWIGQNAKGEQVLVLDSFEHNKDVASIYIPLMKVLLGALDTELYVGSGGQTPKTNAAVLGSSEIKSPDGFHRYEDSHYVYLITEDVALAPKRKYQHKEYDGFDEYLDDNFPIAFNVLYHEDYQVANNLYIGQVYRDTKAIKLLLDNPKLRDFVRKEMQYDEVTEAPLETNITKGLLPGWVMIRSGDIEFTLFHKFSILQALIDQDYDRDQITKIFNNYHTCYGFDPDLMEKIGYENITRLPYEVPSNTALSWSMLRAMILKLKSMSCDEAKGALNEILEDLSAVQNAQSVSDVTEITARAIEFNVKSVDFPEYIDYEKRKELVAVCLKKFDASQTYKTPDFILGNLFYHVPEVVLKALSAEQLFALHDGISFPSIKGLSGKISDDTLLDFLAKSIEKGIVKQISYQFNFPDSLIHYLQLMDVDELMASWDGNVFFVPCHINTLMYSSSQYIKALEISELKGLAKLLKNKDTSCVYFTIEMLQKWDQQTINKLGIENIVNFCNNNPFCSIEVNVDMLAQELQDAIMPEEMTVIANEQYHTVHMAKHLTIPRGISFEVDFPILGFYQTVPTTVYCNVKSTQHGDDPTLHYTYLIGNYGSDSVTLEHI